MSLRKTQRQEKQKLRMFLYQIYHRGYEPPSWIESFMKNSQISKRYLEQVTCYYDEGCLEEAKQLLRYREPVNIALQRLYHEHRLYTAFGYRRSPYTHTSSNIAVYCRTPCRWNDRKRSIHVLNVIAPALDSVHQPDYMRIVLKGAGEYKKMVQGVFSKIRTCVQYHRSSWTTLVLCGFGLGYFSKHTSDFNISATDVFLEYLDKELLQYISSLRVLCLFPLPSNISNNPKWKNHTHVSFASHKIQDLIFKFSHHELKTILFTNAWDPFSIIGNGNTMDASLDGWFGRMTAMSVLGNPWFNPYIQYYPTSTSKEEDLS